MDLTAIMYFTYTFTAIGIVAVVSSVAYFFTSIGKNVDRLKTRQPVPKVQNPAFLRTAVAAAGGALGQLHDEQVETIEEGEVFFERLLDDIDAARETITITTYVWRANATAQQFFSALKRAAARGVTVMLIVDSYGGSSVSRRLLRELTEAGISVGLYHPFEVGKISRYHMRTHRRAFIFDATHAYVGGMAISDEWLQPVGHPERVYTDLMYRIEGEPVLYIQHAFGELWASIKNEVLILPDIPAQQHSPQPDNFIHLSHAPQLDVHPLTYLMWTACAAARDSIDLCSPYFVPGVSVLNILMEKARSGVATTLYLQGPSELSFTKMVTESYYRMLLEAGVRIYEYQPRYLHTKLLVIDRCFTLVGSANYDIRSQRLNQENVLGYVSEGFAASQLAVIEKYREASTEVRPEDCAKLSRFARARNYALRLFSEQF